MRVAHPLPSATAAVHYPESDEMAEHTANDGIRTQRREWALATMLHSCSNGSHVR